MSDFDDITISLPISELLRLLNSCCQIPYLTEKIESVSNRLDGLSSIYLQILDELKEIKKSL